MRPDDLTSLSSLATCPVPPEQLPLNEYDELKESWFFCWATLPVRPYIQKLLWVWVWSLAIAAPVAAASFPPTKYLAQFLLASTGGAVVFVLLALVRLYLGWTYVAARLADSSVVYEESGWYDGQVWTKPSEVLIRDRLVVSYQIQPLLQRMRTTFGVLAGLLVLGIIAWNVF